MSDESSSAETPSNEEVEQQDRRQHLKSLGKWSGAAIGAVMAGGWLASAPQAAGSWINRRGGSRGGSWVNRPGGGGWVNRSGGWLNRSGGWINRRVGGGSWINRW